MRDHPRRRVWLTLLLAVAATRAEAGGAAENVLLVVNSRSEGSKQVANHYVRLRNVPPSNVVYIDWEGSTETVSAGLFRQRILTPVLEAIDERGLGLQVDMVAYSTDFPWRVDFTEELKEKVKLTRLNKPMASLTGATYLFGFVLTESPGLVSLNSNYYVAPVPGKGPGTNLTACSAVAAAPSRGFRSRYAWAPTGAKAPSPKSGVRYLLSTMLGVTSGRGNTVGEVIECLDRAVAAEAEPPRGTFYFMRREGAPRSKPRHACFGGVAEQLRRLGAEARVAAGSTPREPATVAGLMMGDARPEIAAGVRIEPGAICEHLTSYGGDLTRGASQTALTDLIRAGATGSSGTVWEPLAVQAKFPLPSMPLHYRRGCSLAEAFYQSVAAPYQLLIVGDPLCQPWAERPTLSVAGWPTAEADEPIRPGAVSTFGFAELGLLPKPDPQESDAAEAGAEEPPEAALRITPTITPTAGGGATFWELFVDGRLRMRLPSGREASFTAEQLGPGWHALSCVAANPDPIESRRTQSGSIEVLQTPDGEIEPVRIEVDGASADGRLAVSAEAPGAERIVIQQNGREVGVIEGDSGGALVDPKVVGRGPVRLQAVAEPSGAASPPVWTRVE